MVSSRVLPLQSTRGYLLLEFVISIRVLGGLFGFLQLSLKLVFAWLSFTGYSFFYLRISYI